MKFFPLFLLLFIWSSLSAQSRLAATGPENLSPNAGTLIGSDLNTSFDNLTFQWRMYDHFDPAHAYDQGSRYIMGYDRLGHQYLTDYVNPPGWNVEFTIPNNNIQASGARIASFQYTWTFEGISDAFGQHFQYAVTITTTRDGIRAVLPSKKPEGVRAPFPRNTAMMRRKMNDGGSGPVTGNPPTLPLTYDSITQFPSLGLYKVTVVKKHANSRDTTTVETIHQFITLVDYLVVVMGDSFNSGEGNPDIPGESDDACWCKHEVITTITNKITGDALDMNIPAIWLEPEAHRSFGSGAALAAERLEMSDPHSSVTLLTVATSGAKIDQGLLFPQHCEWQNHGQVDEVKSYVGNRPIDFLLLSIGINDVGGGTDGVGAILAEAADPTPPGFQESQVYYRALAAINQIPDKFGLLNDKFSHTLNIKHVLLIQVPANIFRDGQNQVRSTDDGLLFAVEYQDIKLIDQFAFRVTDYQKAAAARYGWTYIDGVVTAFTGHGFFREYTSDSWFVSPEESCLIQGDWNGMIHPNPEGHAKICELVYAGISQLIPVFQVPTQTQ